MSYFLKKSKPSAKGLYLQIYESYYIPGKGKRNRSYRALGYLSDLVEKGISDPIAHYQAEVDKLNEESAQAKIAQIGERSLNKNIGYFLPKAMFDFLDMDEDINYVASTLGAHYKFSEMLRALCYAQIVGPGSKRKAFEKIIPELYGMPEFSYDQILDAVNFIGSDYHKYIEVLNHHIAKHWKRKIGKVYFDCTNFYFEIDREDDFRKKGPCKELRHDPILGQALMLDAEQIPIDTKFYPGNESEIPYLRQRIEDMKARNNVTGRVIQVADKGLNCARNIYAAVVEAHDGYIFSKSVKGTSISADEKKWILLSENDGVNNWTDVRDEDGKLLYRYKVAKSIGRGKQIRDYDTFTYKCKINPDDAADTVFRVKEKRIVTYNPELGKKQRAEIRKQVEKARSAITYKKVIREDLGDAVKYVSLTATDKDGKKVKIATAINEDKVEEDLKLAGHNMIVTSEINADPVEITGVYHNLWRIEESFRIMKSYLEARPVFVSNKNTIFGHFLICYLALTIMRLLELKTFKDEISASGLFNFIRQYNVTQYRDGNFINCATSSETYLKIKETLGLAKLGNVYLSQKDVRLLLETSVDI